MSRHPTDPLRPLTADEEEVLGQISRSRSEPAVHVERAKLLLAVAAGASFSAVARVVGRRSNDAVAHLASRFTMKPYGDPSPARGWDRTTLRANRAATHSG